MFMWSTDLFYIFLLLILEAQRILCSAEGQILVDSLE